MAHENIQLILLGNRVLLCRNNNMLYIKKDERKQMKNVTDLIITKQREETILF